MKNLYGQYCPVSRSLEILGDRWTLLIVRDLLFGTCHFSDMERGLPGISKALLAERLRHLQRAGIIERRVDSSKRRTSYHLTEAGWELRPIIEAFLGWGAKWAFGEPEPVELDPVLLMWWMKGRVIPERLPGQRVVVEFSFREATLGTYWLILQPDDVSVCLTHPGFEIDVFVNANLAIFYQVWMGRMAFEKAIRDQSIELDALPALMRAFPHWFAWSPAAEAVRRITGNSLQAVS